jgi:exonuclease SbcD
MQKLEMNTFNKALDKCVELGVDFILVSGDLFHVGIPELGVVNEALQKMRKVQQSNIPIYVIYGSHDYTPTGTTIVDILGTAGIIIKVVKWRIENGKLKLDFTVDHNTGAKIAGLSARKMGLESKYYELLDKSSLEETAGFKILAFHSGLTEFKPTYLSAMETVPISCFPKDFDYYAGGHIHERGEFKLPGYENVVFPGPLFTGYGRDLEATAKGARRGFYVVSFDDKVRKMEFVDLKAFDSTFFEYDATGKNSLETSKDMRENLRSLDVKGKIVVLNIRGELSGGKTSDIDFTRLKSGLIESGALYVHLNRYGLTSKEYSVVRIMGEDISTIENKMLMENIGAVKVSKRSLRGEGGALLARKLLNALKQEAKVNESKSDYLERMLEGGIEILGLKEIFGVNEH